MRCSCFHLPLKLVVRWIVWIWSGVVTVEFAVITPMRVTSELVIDEPFYQICASAALYFELMEEEKGLS